MTAPELAGAEWRKSSRSNGQGQCVEVAQLGTAVAVRDSKHPAPRCSSSLPPSGPPSSPAPRRASSTSNRPRPTLATPCKGSLLVSAHLILSSQSLDQS